jgi:hypothetical protein
MEDMLINKLNGFNNGRDTTEGVGGSNFWIDALRKINIPNPVEKGCIIYVDNDDKEISRDYLKPKPENPI